MRKQPQKIPTLKASPDSFRNSLLLWRALWSLEILKELLLVSCIVVTDYVEQHFNRKGNVVHVSLIEGVSNI
ncbi:hypothetical protein DW355_00540 [Hylemonella gracilis]|uniref:Uncharacterized protein n=1 Tax=Hylemonella gracilis TaxID=80880 RepID=A0A4P6UE76_9BURK|nr:hypothetical protein DW355_00540 [Hylemonella gracilis]